MDNLAARRSVKVDEEAIGDVGKLGEVALKAPGSKSQVFPGSGHPDLLPGLTRPSGRDSMRKRRLFSSGSGCA